MMGFVEYIPQSDAVVNLLTGDVIDLKEWSVQGRGGCEEAVQYMLDHDLCVENSTIDEVLTFTIETERDCNLTCVYCYQNDAKYKERISFDVIENTVDFIERSCQYSGIFNVVIRLIGGEPLLARREILYLVELLSQVENMHVSYHVDTNGCLPIQWLLDVIEEIDISICLTLPSDHNRLRYSAGHDSATRIYKNLEKLQTKSKQSITLHYNCHSGNLDDFADFLDWVEPLKNTPVTSINVANIDNYEYNVKAFHNDLCDEEYKTWKVTTAIPLLLRHEWVVPFQIHDRVTRCQGHHPYSCKIYADGSVTICDAMKREQARCNVKELVTDPSLINEVYREIKLRDPLADLKCFSCTEKLVCGGMKWCMNNTCQSGEAKWISRENLQILLCGTEE